MPEVQPVCTEMDCLPVLAGVCLLIVFGITDNRTAYMRKLDADLVMSTGVQSDR